MPDDSDSHDEQHRNAFDGYEPDVASCARYVANKMQNLIVVGLKALNIRHAIIKHMDAYGAHRASTFVRSPWL